MGQIVELRVEGMDCAACERRLAAVLGGLDGIGGVEADHTTGVVRVRLAPSRVGADVLTADVLTTEAVQRIERAGFTVTSSQQQQEGARS
jgi:copper chaperone CopZ